MSIKLEDKLLNLAKVFSLVENGSMTLKQGSKLLNYSYWHFTRLYKRYHKEGVEALRLWFVDILGQLKGFSISTSELDRALEPDHDTFFVLPWKVGGVATGVMLCDIYYPDGKPFESDPRYVLKRNLKRLPGFEENRDRGGGSPPQGGHIPA